MKVLTAAEARIARVLGQAIFPREAQGLPDGHEAKVVDYLDELLAAALPFERTQLRGLLQLMDRGYGAFAGSPTARMVDAHGSEVEAWLRSWEESPIYSRRMLLEAVRSLYLMAWFGSTRVREDLSIDTAPDPDAPMDYLRKIVEGMEELEAAEATGPAPARPDTFLGRPDGLLEFSDYGGDIRESCDLVVVGSGPGGTIVALEAARAGKRVIVVEAGPVARKQDLVRDGGMTMTRLFWDSGMRTTRGNVIMPTMQAKVLGGGSLINSAICLRATPHALDAWAEDWGVEGLSVEELAPHYQAVEQFMGVKPVDPAMQGPRNDLFAKGAAAVGLNAVPIERNEAGCLGSGGCLYGCRNGAKLSNDRRGIPELLEAGGRVYTSVECEQLIMRGNRVAGIEGRIVEPWTGRRTGTVRIMAKATVLAAGVMHTPVICQRSGLTADPIGSNLRMHPGTVVVGDFDEPVMPWYGATQGMHVLDMLQYGIKLETLWADAALMAIRLPSLGARFKRQVSRYKYMAPWDAWVSGEDSVGRVRYVAGAPRPSITYDIGLGDLRRLQHATATLAEMFFAAGAHKVYPAIGGLPQVLRSPDDIPTIRTAKLKATDIPSGSNHVFGTMPMGDDPAVSATTSDFRVHGVDDLYVSDSSLFPTSPGVNPMLTIWAVAHKLGGQLAERY